MALINEDFARCQECDNPHFIPEKVVLISKSSPAWKPLVIKEYFVYKCSKCGYKQYKEE